MIRSRVLTVVAVFAAAALIASPALAQKKKAGSKGGAASATLDRALKLYDSDELHSASIELYKVIEGESGDSEANKQKAEFWMGKTLYKLGFYSAALTYFDKIVQKGPSHAHYNETLKWLASLSREVPDSSRHPGQDRQVRPQGAGAAGAGERARRALLPARQVPLQQGQVQGSGRPVQHGPA